ncbi:MAG: phage tail protein, partial [Alphaproteobacteria bacterium]|nr:phage tail protein [Alphaproteobacteria bacterium]
MASLVLTVGGSAIGNALLPGIGGALLGGVGAYVGGQIDGAIFGNSKIAGPRLDTLKIQDSTYGKTIPVVYGNARVAGNVIWASDLIETLSSDQVGGKGGGNSSASVQRASYAVDCAIAIGMGTLGGSIGSIRTIWADSKIIYSDGQWKANIVTDAEFYFGSDTQIASPLMEGYLGVGNVPAYRGLAYVVLHRLQLANFGNRLPNMTFECYPADAPVAPAFLGEVNPSLFSRPQTLSSYGAMPAIPIARNGAGVTRMLVGGIIQTGMAFQFAALEMDVTGAQPIEIRRTLSASITRGNLTDVAWAQSPDGLSVACYMLHDDAANPATIGIYNMASHSFGNLITDNLGYPSALNQVAWLDEQRFVLQDAVSGQVGVRVYARAGTKPAPLGFMGVWGAGSSAIRKPLPFAQFCKLSGGLCMVMADALVTPNSVYARSLSWQNNSLQIGDELLVSNGLAGFSSTSAAILPISNNEFVLARLGTSEIRLMSFTANFNSVVVTRNWNSIVVTPAGDLSISIKDGRISFIDEQFSTSNYRYGEISITATSFALSATPSLVSGSYFGTLNNFSFYPIDTTRFLVQAGTASGDVWRLAIIQRGQAEQNLGAIVTDVLNRAGYAVTDYDVSALGAASVQGYVVDNVSSARSALEPLQIYQPFDLVETDGILKAKSYTATADISVITTEARAATEKQEQPPSLQTTRGQELDLPREISVDYLDAALGFQRGTQRATRIASHARAVEAIKLPVICPADKAKQIAQSQLYRRWVERNEHEIHLSRNYIKLDVGDVIRYGGQVMRVAQMDQQGGILKTLAVPVSDQVLSISATAESGNGATRDELALISSALSLLDIPQLRQGANQPGYYVAVSGSAAWPGASLMRSTDGINYAAQDSFSLPATIGLATSILSSRPAYYMDRVSSVTISLLRGSLSSCSFDDLLNGTNAALLGDEIIQFQNANLNADGTITLSNLLRGRKGSEAATATHTIGERFILLQASTIKFMPLNLSDKGRKFYFRAPSFGQDNHDVVDTIFYPQLNNLKPLPPEHVTAA